MLIVLTAVSSESGMGHDIGKMLNKNLLFDEIPCIHFVSHIPIYVYFGHYKAITKF